MGKDVGVSVVCLVSLAYQLAREVSWFEAA